MGLGLRGECAGCWDVVCGFLERLEEEGGGVVDTYHCSVYLTTGTGRMIKQWSCTIVNS